MRDYTVQELSVPSTYDQDAELAALARRIAMSRWTAHLGVSLAEWKQSHLRGEHAEILKCAVDAFIAHERRAQAHAHHSPSALCGFTPPEGWTARVDGGFAYLTGSPSPSLSAALRRAGGETITGTSTWRIPLSRAGTLSKLFSRAAAQRFKLIQGTPAQRIERWLSLLDEKAGQGWVYSKAITVLGRLGIREYPQLQARMSAILMRAAAVAALPPSASAGDVLVRPPSTRLPRRLLPLKLAPPLGVPTRLEGDIVVFTSSTKPFPIRPEHPRIYGASLSPHLGAPGAYFYYRPAAPTELETHNAHQDRRDRSTGSSASEI